MRDTSIGEGPSAPSYSDPIDINATPRRAKTQNDLMDAAFDIFVSKGVDGPSIYELATSAGYTRGAFHSNFVSKEHLFLATLERELSREQAAMQLRLDAIDSDILTKLKREDAVDILASAVTAGLFDGGNLYGRVTLFQELKLLALQRGEFATAYQRIVQDTFTELENHIRRLDQHDETQLRLDSTTAARRILALFTNEILDIAIGREDYAKAQKRIYVLLVDILDGMVTCPSPELGQD